MKQPAASRGIIQTKGDDMNEDQRDTVEILIKTLEYYADSRNYHDIKTGCDCIFMDTGQRARLTLNKFYDDEDCERAGFCSDICLPKSFKFIECADIDSARAR